MFRGPRTQSTLDEATGYLTRKKATTVPTLLFRNLTHISALGHVTWFVCSASTPRALKASCMRTQGAPQNVAFSAPSALYQHTGFDTSKSETGVFSVIQDLTTTCLASAWKRFTVAAIRLPQPVPYCVHASCNNSLAWCGYVCDDRCRWWEWGTGAKGYLT